MKDILVFKNIIAKRAAQEIYDEAVVNLGIGLPTLVANYIDKNINIHLHSENGFVEMDEEPNIKNWDKDIVNASGRPASIKKGAAFFDSATAFGMIRGGHIDISILGALEVDETGSIASWNIPGIRVPGMGGAMDLVVGAKKIIVTMLHTEKGQAKILKKCTLPLTAKNEVNMIITEMGVMNITKNGIELIEYNPNYTINEIKKATNANLIINNPKKMIV